MSDQNTQLAILPPAALARNVDHATWNALSEIYGDPSPEKLGLVLDYCRARKMDPLKKPVHIVPVWSKKKNQMVETIWPAISEVRATAMRTNLYAGREATVFGPTIKARVGSVEMQYPEWAQVTVYRIVGGHRCAFVGPICEWLECYSRMGKDPAPNSMWQKRAKGQLDKCAEAAALRAAFPEETGGVATAEEMEGKEIGDIDEMTTAGEATIPDRPKVQRAARGAAKALEAAEAPAQNIATAATHTVESAAKAVVEEVAQTVTAAAGTTARAADIAKASANAVDAEVTTPAGPITALRDREGITVICEVAEFVAKDFGNAQKSKPAVRAVLKGEYTGVAFDDITAKLVDGKVVCSPAWDLGKRKFVLFGKARVDGSVATMVKSIEVIDGGTKTDEPPAF